MEIGYDYFRQSFEPRFIDSEDEGPVNTPFHQGVEEIQPNIPEAQQWLPSRKTRI